MLSNKIFICLPEHIHNMPRGAEAALGTAVRWQCWLDLVHVGLTRTKTLYCGNLPTIANKQRTETLQENRKQNTTREHIIRGHKQCKKTHYKHRYCKITRGQKHRNRIHAEVTKTLEEKTLQKIVNCRNIYKQSSEPLQEKKKNIRQEPLKENKCTRNGQNERQLIKI